MLPNTKITISKDGTTKIEGLERTDQCYKLSDLGAAAGKVSSDEDKDHAPVHQKVNQKGTN